MCTWKPGKPLPVAEPLLDQLVQAIDRQETLALVTVIHAEGDYAPARKARLLVRPDEGAPPQSDTPLSPATVALLAGAARRQLASGKSATLTVADEHGSLRLFVDCHLRPPHLIICGAGHIALPLAAMAKLCDFEVTVIDDRTLYASRERFPSANRVLAGPFRDQIRTLRSPAGPFHARTCLVLVTRGHQHDMDCLLELLTPPYQPIDYVGMIGSRRRIRAVFDLLEREYAVDPAALDRVHAPVGIDIASRTPGEIAVAILAEIINVRNGGASPSLSEPLRAQRRARRNRAQTTPEPAAPTLPPP